MTFAAGYAIAVGGRNAERQPLALGRPILPVHRLSPLRDINVDRGM